MTILIHWFNAFGSAVRCRSVTGTSSASGAEVVTRKYLYDQIKMQNLPTLSEKLNYYENHLLNCYGNNENAKKCLKRRFSNVKSQIKQRWLKANKHEDDFLKHNKSWLEGTFEIPMQPHSPQGRPPKPFGGLSERSKRRKTEEVRATLNDEVIVHAAKSNDGIHQLTAQQALQMFVEADLTRGQYEIIRATNPKLYPCYDLLLKAKRECSLKKESQRAGLHHSTREQLG
ncbi:uncharacterized protein LOC143911733 isoform X2 [Arctopsyche grandis]|uniref:uncharacterized protein LOC143911733 isoform X2 n=1 Tax=Arctopsyche grandis TaxID=121162 RepID=UPI00406D9FB0